MADTFKPITAAPKSIQGVKAIVCIRGVSNPQSPNWTILRSASYELKCKGSGKETPNSFDGMLRTPGLNDFSGGFKGHTNPDDPVESNVVVNGTYDVRLYRTNSYAIDGQGNVTNLAGPFWLARVLISDGGVSSGVSDTEDWDFSFDKQSGVLVFPDGVTTW